MLRSFLPADRAEGPVAPAPTAAAPVSPGGGPIASWRSAVISSGVPPAAAAAGPAGPAVETAAAPLDAAMPSAACLDGAANTPPAEHLSPTAASWRESSPAAHLSLAVQAAVPGPAAEREASALLQARQRSPRPPDGNAAVAPGIPPASASPGAPAALLDAADQGPQQGLPQQPGAPTKPSLLPLPSPVLQGWLAAAGGQPASPPCAAQLPAAVPPRSGDAAAEAALAEVFARAHALAAAQTAAQLGRAPSRGGLRAEQLLPPPPPLPPPQHFSQPPPPLPPSSLAQVPP